METTEIVKAIRKEFYKRLEKNVGWGMPWERERIKLEFEAAVGDALGRLMEEEKNGR